VKVYHGPKPTSEQPSEFVTVAFDRRVSATV